MTRFEVLTIIGAPPSKVWEVLTKPELVKRYMSGTEIVTDWKIGSPIRWTGVVNDKPYENRGTVLKVVPAQLLEYTYWSNLSGLPDMPANYATITCILDEEREGTMLTVIVRDNRMSAEASDNVEWGWKKALSRIAKIAEEL